MALTEALRSLRLPTLTSRFSLDDFFERWHDALLACLTSRTRMVFLANPNNPTGSYLAADELARLHAGLPPDVLLVIDAAYAEYVRRNDYSSGVELVADGRIVPLAPERLPDPNQRVFQVYAGHAVVDPGP